MEELFTGPDPYPAFKTEDKLVVFLYTLMRDELVPGKVAELVRDLSKDKITSTQVMLTNGFLAQYANYIATKLREPL